MRASLPDALRASTLILPTSRVLVALSGGPDSCALLLALCALADAGALPRPVGAAHFHHGLRSADADADAAFSAALCARLGVPCLIGLGAAQPQRGESPNAAARDARYDFLRESALFLNANAIATAHTRDDQAETVLGRVFRGTSVDGLAGIPASRDLGNGVNVIRPLLTVRRTEIEAYCASHDITPRHDPSNEKPRYTRSRLRRRLPELAAEFNPQLTDALVRLAEQAAKDSNLLTNRAETYCHNNVWVARGPVRSVDAFIPHLQELHPAVRSRVLLRMLQRSAPDAVAAELAATMAFVERLETLIAASCDGASVDLPGKTRAYCHDDYLIVAQTPVVEARRQEEYLVALAVPGETTVAAARLRLTACERPIDEPPQRARRSRAIDMAYNFVDAPPLVVRPAAPGERFAPLGMGGRTRSVRDLLAEAGVPEAQRATAPIVARGDTGEALWLIGVCQSESTRVTESSTGEINGRVLRLSAAFEKE